MVALKIGIPKRSQFTKPYTTGKPVSHTDFRPNSHRYHYNQQFLHDSDSITKEFVSQVEPTKTTDAELVEDFLPELSRLNLECACQDGLSRYNNSSFASWL